MGTTPYNNETTRKVQFTLFTDKDFSANNNTITFKVSIQNSASQTLWDSTFAPMQIKDIPKAVNKLVVEKAVPNNDPSLLKVGFYYTIDNVGSSWHIDLFNAGEIFKQVEYDFQ